MTDLLTRLESGSGNDHQLNIDICEKLGLAPKEYFGSKVTSYSWESGVINTEKARHLDALRPPPILTSIDASLSLVERMLPGSFYFLGKGKLKPDEPLFAAQIYKPGDIGDEGLLGEAEHASSQPRALLIALLRALDQEPQT